jgi:excinuclease ABC subunit A
VATITEIYDYLRILYSRVGHPHCLVCGDPISKLSNEEIKNFILEKIEEKKKDLQNQKQKFPMPVYAEIFAPVVSGRKGEYYQLLYDLLGKGYSEVLVDGVRKNLRERIELSKTKKHSIDVLVDSISILEFIQNKQNAEERLSESLERALLESEGVVNIVFRDMSKESQKDYKPENFFMSSKLSCPKDGYSYPEIEPRLFSFNSPYGACTECNGLGTRHFFWK